jgi:hypothetical protein
MFGPAKSSREEIMADKQTRRRSREPDIVAGNGLIDRRGENDVMDAKTLPQVKMPNRDGFIPLFPNKH